MDGKWEILDSKDIYDNGFVKVEEIKVELPDKTQFDQPAITLPRCPMGGVKLVVNPPGKGILMLWRHRLVPDTWTWELPGGGIEKRELPSKAAARELKEETGWRAGKVEPLIDFQPCSAILDHKMHTFITHEATWEGPDRDRNESADVAWLSVDEIKQLMKKGDVSDGPSLVALLHVLSFDLVV